MKLSALLGPTPAALRRAEEPLRAELFGADQLAAHARHLASTDVVDPERGPNRLLDRLDRNERALRAFHREIRKLDSSDATPAAVWMLDNFYLIEEQLLLARHHLPRRYSQELPRLAAGPSRGFPRVYGMVVELVSHLDAQLDPVSLASFFAAYQEVVPLKLGELWAVPIMLRLALIENLQRMALHLSTARVDRETADYWMERMQRTCESDPSRVVVVVAEMAEADVDLSNAFVAQFSQRIARKHAALRLAQEWLEQRLAIEGRSTEQVVRLDGQMQAANQVTVSNCIESMRYLGAEDWRNFVEDQSEVERVLRGDPSGVYRRMDFATRDRYRHVVEGLARYGRLPEAGVAAEAVRLACEGAASKGAEDRSAHVGYYLVGDGAVELELRAAPRWPPLRVLESLIRRAPLLVYLGCVGVITLAAATGFALWAQANGEAGWRLWLLTSLFAFAASHAAVAVANWALMLVVAPRLLPRMDFSRGIPEEYPTLVVVPTMIANLSAVDRLMESLEVQFLANRDERLSFALLTDFPDAECEEMPGDAALLQHAQAGIDRLRRRYPGRPVFFLLHRPRRWNPAEGVWMGYERKRGKLADLNALLRGAPAGAFHTAEGAGALRGTRYVITLDTDTQLPRDAARRLVETIAHPLNRAVMDPVRGVITRGYGILQPRVSISLPSSRRSWFVRLFAGDAGIDPYTGAVSDVYQDLFGEGAFIGKGIYDVDAFEGSLRGRFPENTILSHDLIESCHARSGLISDVELFEPFPYRYGADIDRRHRWTRGDWQIARWVLPRVPSGDGSSVPTPLSALSRWKLLDNLRRSLVPLALVAFLLGSWTLFPASLISMLAVLSLLTAPLILSGASDLWRLPEDASRARHLRQVAGTFARKLLQALLSLAFLPYEAAVNADAIVRSLVRSHITLKGRLEWRVSGESGRTSGFLASCASMWIAPALAVAAALYLAWAYPAELAWAAPILCLWFAAPWIAWRISQPIPAPRANLSPGQVEFLHRTALKTWGFFETFVTANENWLPPDNYQEAPLGLVASRTSPTNIGLSLLANLAAHDFGYLSAGRLIHRTEDTFRTLARLEKHRGHFFNWYDTRTLEPLPPRYISTVDSGNLAGFLLTLAGGLREVAGEPIVAPQALSGIRDTIGLLRHLGGEAEDLDSIETTLAQNPVTLRAMHGMFEQAHAQAVEFAAGLPLDAADDLRRWALLLATQCGDHLGELLHLTPWLAVCEPGLTEDEEEHAQPTLRELAALEIRTGMVSPLPPGPASARLEALERLAQECERLAQMDWAFLYDQRRKLFVIGYNFSEHRFDDGHYDLLASEARLGSYVAIAQGAVGQDHWFSLVRLLVAAGGEPIMVSWSGSMFEYLMPQLVMPSHENTLIDRTCISAVRHQIAHGRIRGVPWGVSESGYNRTDAAQNYQYRAFGVPGIGLKRGLAEDLVIAPYASVMALMVAPLAACENLQRLSKEGREGEHGFYEAVDYTPSRMPPNEKSVVVRSFMAHHLGMSLLALVSLLCGKPMQRRFDSIPMLRAAGLLLQERVPQAEAGVFSPEMDAKDAPVAHEEAGAAMRTFTTPHSAAPEVHLLSNGRYHVAISSAGGGFSRWNGLDVTRWREDATRDCWGLFIYVRDTETGKFWSVAHQPTLHATKQYEAIFAQGRAEFRQHHGGLSIHTEVGVAPEDDIEIRRVSITNLSDNARSIELTSCAEVVMAEAASDAAHPAFSNLFVQTSFDPELSAIFCTRRPRSHEEHPPCMLHLIAGCEGQREGVSYETDRARFVGRTGSRTQPDAIRDPRPLSNTAGSVLDPIVSLRCGVRLEPGATLVVPFLLGMATGREAAGELAKRYQSPRRCERAFNLAWTQSQVTLRQLGASEAEAQLYGRLAGSLIYANPAYRADPATLRRNRRGQSSLWAFGISGDVPIVLLGIGDVAHIEIVEQLAKAHAFWRLKGLTVEVVIVNEDVSAYRQPLHDAIIGVIALSIGAHLIDKPGGIFVRRRDQIGDENLMLLQSVARVVLDASHGPLARQMGEGTVPEPRYELLPHLRRRRRSREHAAPAQRPLLFDNGIGGFSADGREYIITLRHGQNTPAPWINVIANRFFGTAVSESGAAYTWLENAREYRVTPWSNDPVQDTSGEALYIRDEETGQFWSPTPMPARGASPYIIRHGFGYTVFEHVESGIASELTVFVAADAPVKFMMLKLRNLSGEARRLSATAYFEWVLADVRKKGLMHAHTEIDPRTGALLAHNSYHADFPDRVAFLDVNDSAATLTGDRREFIGRNGMLTRPAAMRHKQLSGRVGAGLDPCGAAMVPVDLRAGEERDIVIRLGVGRSPADVHTLITRFRSLVACRAALDGIHAQWRQTLGAVEVETPDPAVNVMVNGWLLYQTLSCRLWARTGFYQSGGAYGFRDQLQDCMALMHAEPALAREHLLRAAGRQFTPGDVQHWWHPPVGRGVRTRFSDDFLWLPFAVCHYVASVGDEAILDESVPFIEGRELRADEESYYDLPMRSDESATLYAHCVRAIENGLAFGSHGLPLIGCGDWNDGMNKVGIEGRGESVWLAFFLFTVLRQFAEVASRRDDTPFANRCLEQAEALRGNIEKHAWDGSWYRRAYFDDGTPLGSSTNVECQIDSLPQSWSVISGAGAPDRSRVAMEAVDQRLVSRGDGLIRLFDPPFDRSDHDPGYIKGYIPGVRENGGQYTHAAIWTIMAFALMGEHERAWELFALINPVNHGATPEQIAKYKVEPYVAAADVYSVAPHTGRGGWTWYTGSASWMYRLLVETLLGISLEKTNLTIAPRLPAAWDSITVLYRYRRARYRIAITQSGQPTASVLTLDGTRLPGQQIPLADEDREHFVELAVRRPEAQSPQRAVLG